MADLMIDGTETVASATVEEHEVWEERRGRRYRRHSGERGLSLRVATMIATDWNDEEAENARMERRKVGTRYFVVKATTTFEEIE